MFILFMIYDFFISMALLMMMMMMMMMSTLAILTLFPQNIPNISLFPSMAMNLADLATRGVSRSIDFRCIYSFTRSIS